MSRFVRPETTILSISPPPGKEQPDTLTVKTRLNYGEQRAMYARLYQAGADGALKTNPMGVGLSTVLAYLLDWSLTDENGKQVVIAGQPIEIVLSALDALDSDDFREIRTAIETHEQAVTAAREQEKKKRLAGATPSAATSPSPSAVAGA